MLFTNLYEVDVRQEIEEISYLLGDDHHNCRLGVCLFITQLMFFDSIEMFRTPCCRLEIKRQLDINKI